MVKKGINIERQLVRKLWNAGFAAIRVPASGAGSSNFPKPDIICGNGKRYLAFEVKSTKNEILYINKYDIESLTEFCEIFGAEPYLAVKFSFDKIFYFIDINELLITASKNYKITKDLIIEKGITFDMLVKNSVKINLNW
ncbi:MAG: Holliday junction resolvase Hjc [Candidatus Helarchaeota archaeon]